MPCLFLSLAGVLWADLGRAPRSLLWAPSPSQAKAEMTDQRLMEAAETKVPLSSATELEAGQVPTSGKHRPKSCYSALSIYCVTLYKNIEVNFLESFCSRLA